MSKYQNLTAWGAQILMGVLYIIASSGKVVSDVAVVQMFEYWGYPYGFYMIIGILELLGGILLFYPLTAGYASVVLMAVMIGATLTHIVHDEGLIVLKPLAYMAVLILIFYLRFVLAMKDDDKEQYPLNEAV